MLRAAQGVGPTGRAIGVDMTPEMVARARANARKVAATNVDFRLGEKSDVYFGYARPLTGEVWYKDFFRVEYRLNF